jgi:hypothetical protein
MDAAITSALATILQQGLLGALLIGAFAVIWWQQRRYDRLLEKYDQKSDHMYDQALAIKDAYNSAMNQKAETERVVADKLAQLVSNVTTVAQGIQQLIYRRENL